MNVRNGIRTYDCRPIVSTTCDPEEPEKLKRSAQICICIFWNNKATPAQATIEPMATMTEQKNDKKDASGIGAAGFDQTYWDENYAEPEIMDNIYNARRRALALKALFDSEYIEVTSMIDLGFGLGHLFRHMIRTFLPFTVVGIEPSAHPFNQLERESLTDVESVQLSLFRMDILSWCLAEDKVWSEPYDLGICTSVFQYLSDPEIEQVVPILAQRVKYLYFSVPVTDELRYQREELGFHDRFALSRTQAEYRDLLGEHFTIVSNRVLESSVHFDPNTSYFSDMFYRF